MTEDAEIDGLAAEYVLGSLSAHERAEVAARLSSDANLAAAVMRWERRLAPLSHREPGIPPPTDALARILAGIAQHETAVGGRDGVVALRRKAQVWQRTAYALAATIAVLAIGLGLLIDSQVRDSPGTLVAVLDRQASNPTADEPEFTTGPVFLVTLQVGSRTLEVRQIAGRRPPVGSHFAVWLTAAGGAETVLLGTIARLNRSATLTLPPRAVDPQPGRTLAVSVESDMAVRAPTGPFISIGRLEGKPH